jgi:hypothetical protein
MAALNGRLAPRLGSSRVPRWSACSPSPKAAAASSRSSSPAAPPCSGDDYEMEQALLRDSPGLLHTITPGRASPLSAGNATADAAASARADPAEFEASAEATRAVLAGPGAQPVCRARPRACPRAASARPTPVGRHARSAGGGGRSCSRRPTAARCSRPRTSRRSTRRSTSSRPRPRGSTTRSFSPGRPHPAALGVDGQVI